MYVKLAFIQSLGNCTKEIDKKLPVTQCCIIQTTQPFTPNCAIKQELVADSTLGSEWTARSTKTLNLLHNLGWQLNNELSICVIDYTGTSFASDTAFDVLRIVCQYLYVCFVCNTLIAQ
jgi:hypothetical protein